MSAPDWNQAEETLYQASVAAIRRFSQSHPEVECCHFAFDSEPRYGYVLFSFDSTVNSLRSAMEMEECVVRRRPLVLGREDGWRNASYNLRYPRLAPFGDSSGGFAFMGFDEIKFPDWSAFAESPEYPQREPNCDDYLDGHFRVLVWRVAERLIASEAFGCIRMAAPFLVSYGIHDQDESILRIINWPDVSGEAQRSVSSDSPA